MTRESTPDLPPDDGGEILKLKPGASAVTLAFRPEDPTVEAGLRRMGDAALSAALSDLDGDLPLSVRVRRIRSTIRQLRGLLKIVRPAFPAYRTEHPLLCEAARGLVDLRDSAAMAEIARAARPYLSTILDPDLAEDLAVLLDRDRIERESLEDVPARLRNLKVALLSASERVGSWALGAEEGAALSGGITETVRRAQCALAVAGRHRRAEDFAALRKQVRHHRCHAQLLRPMMEGPMTAHLALADAAIEAIEAHRDLTLLSALLDRLQGRMSPGTRAEAVAAIADRQATMEPVILGLARALLAEEPQSVARRFVTYWEVRRSGWLDPDAASPPKAIAAL